MRNLDLEKTLGAKINFEKLVGRSDNTVNNYNADNGKYDDNGFMTSLNAKNQTITFCGIGAHHQNGIVERRIRTVTKIARTIIFHAQR